MSMSSFPTVILSGTSNGGSVVASTREYDPTNAYGSYADYLYMVAGATSTSTGWNIWSNSGKTIDTCPPGVTNPVQIRDGLSASSTAAFLTWVNGRLARGVTLVPNSPGLKYYKVSPGTITVIRCSIAGSNPEARASISWVNMSTAGNAPPNSYPVCTLASGDITYDFKASTYNVTGISQTKTISISCTEGSRAKSYRVRMTSASGSDGKINFGNNVSASFRLGNSALPVNGTGVSLSLRSSTYENLVATLNGTSTSAGESYASGILIFEAL